MAVVEPIPGERAAVADLGDERALVVADYHAGIEAALRYDQGVELENAADSRRERLLTLFGGRAIDRLVLLGDVGTDIGRPRGDEREELDALFDAVTERVPVTLVPGNHDGGIVERYEHRVDVTPQRGVRMGGVGFLHGHTWPDPDVLAADVVCMGHEHATVRLTDEVGGSRMEPAWLRGPLAREPFLTGLDIDAEDLPWNDPELVVFPAFNERSGGTWVNVEQGSFLSPFLREGLVSGDVYLLDGTRLGDFRRV